MEGADILSIVRDVVLGLSAIAVAFFAWLGLKTWRRDLTGRARFETARNMMRIGFELKDNFGRVRYISTKSYEYADRTTQAEESDAESQVLNEWHVKTKRLNSVVESLKKIIEVQWEAEILLNEISVQSIKEAIQSYRASYGDLSSAIETYFEIRYDEARTKELYQNQEWLRGLKKTIYSAANDEFSQKVDEPTDKLSYASKQYVK